MGVKSYLHCFWLVYLDRQIAMCLQRELWKKTGFMKKIIKLVLKYGSENFAFGDSQREIRSLMEKYGYKIYTSMCKCLKMSHRAKRK